MAHFTKLGDLDMRFNSSRSIIARRNFWGIVGSIFLYPLIFPFIFLYYVVIGILKGMRWLFLSVMSLYDALGKKKVLAMHQGYACICFNHKSYYIFLHKLIYGY